MSRSEHTILGGIYFNRALLFCMLGTIVVNNADGTLNKITVAVAAVAMIANFLLCIQESKRAKEC